MSKLWYLYSFGGLILVAITFLAAFIVYALAERGTVVAQRAKLIALMAGFGVISPVLCVNAWNLVAHLRTYRLDYYVFKIDGLLGFQPSFAVGVLCRKSPLLFWSTGITYNFLTCGILIVQMLYVFKLPVAEVYRYMVTFLLNFFAIVPLYVLVPVCGPKYAFGAAFPFQVPSHVLAHPVLIPGAAPNGVPSGHVSAALLMLFFLWRWPVGRVLGGLFAALTILATLGTGEHYLLDLILAVPYAAAVNWAAQRVAQRTQSSAKIGHLAPEALAA